MNSASEIIQDIIKRVTYVEVYFDDKSIFRYPAKVSRGRNGKIIIKFTLQHTGLLIGTRVFMDGDDRVGTGNIIAEDHYVRPIQDGDSVQYTINTVLNYNFIK